MASQGFFSGSESAEKRRFAGEKKNNANFSTRVEPVKVANLYNNQTPSLDYAPDDVGSYIKDSETKSYEKSEEEKYKEKIQERNKIAESFGVNTTTGPTYTERDESKFGGEILRSQFPGVPDRVITTKERIVGVTDPRYAKESGFTVTPKKFDKGTAFQIGVSIDQNKYGLLPSKVLGEDIGGMYNFKDKDYGETTKAFVAGMIQNQEDAMQTEARLKKEQKEKEAYEKRLKGSEEWQAAQKKFEEDRKKFLNDRMNQKTIETESPVKEETSTVDKVFGFLDALGKVKYVGPQMESTGFTAEDTRKLGTMPSMGISEAGREEAEKNRLEKAKEEGENRNILQRVGDFVGDTFNKLTGTDAAEAGTLQAQGINTSATTNIAQMGGVSDDVQRARDAIAKSNLRKSGLDKTVGGRSSQANYGRASRGFGTGTHGKGMPSNPGSQRQTGVGVSAGNLSRHSVGSSANQPSTTGGINRSQSRRRGSSGNSGRKGGSSSSGGGSSSSSSSGTKGGAGRTASAASKRNTGRSRSQCDIRTKIDIFELTNTNLFRDDLADVAYFVKEIK